MVDWGFGGDIIEVWDDIMSMGYDWLIESLAMIG